MTDDFADPEPMAGRSAGADLAIGHFTGAADVVQMRFIQLTLNGPHSFVRSSSIDGPVAAASLLEPGAATELCVTTRSGVAVLARDQLGLVLINARPGETQVSVAAESEKRAEALEQRVRSRVPASAPTDSVSIRTWSTNHQGAFRSNDRDIDAPTWSSISDGYAAPTQAQLDELVSLTRPTQHGKLILWHGEPGTGKTTAVRALLREWAPWCSGQYIADPERFFADPAYIAEVLARPVPRSSGPSLRSAGNHADRWRLVIAEDCDEYLRSSARRDAGAALGRLLNLTDGILGQGVRVLLLLTTNEELHRLHPALTRPGRCLARIEFPKLSPVEAARFLPPGHVIPDRERTLAELYEKRGVGTPIGLRDDEPAVIGQYL